MKMLKKVLLLSFTAAAFMLASCNSNKVPAEEIVEAEAAETEAVDMSDVGYQK